MLAVNATRNTPIPMGEWRSSRGRGPGSAPPLRVVSRAGDFGSYSPAWCRTSCHAVQSEIGSADAVAVPIDLTAPGAVDELLALTRERFGAPDVLVNAAGVAWMVPAEDLEMADWHRVFNINIHALFELTQAVGRSMIESGGGVIINVASMAGSAWHARPRGLHRLQTRRGRVDQGAGDRMGALWHSRQLPVPRCHRDRDGAQGDAPGPGGVGGTRRPNPVGSAGDARRAGGDDRIHGVPRCLVRQRT